MSRFSLYIHIPYCQAKCPYCDFNSHAVPNWPEQQYVGALRAELRHYAQRRPWLGGEVSSVFFGGGTPSLFSPASIGRVLHEVGEWWTFGPDVETTLEANPGTVSLEKLDGFCAAGINRISFGVQSFAAHHLRTLGRIHSADEAMAGVRWAQKAGFNSVSLDLIFGLPEQTLQEWEDDLVQACALGPNHVSAYNLTYEEGTPFHLWRTQGKLRQLSDEIEAAMFSRTQSILGNAGYRQYEISNYAQPAHACRHNLNYWQSGPYLGVGAGAHSYLPSGRGTVDLLATTPFETPPEEGCPSGRAVASSISQKSSVRAEETPSSQGPSRSPRSGLSTPPLPAGEGSSWGWRWSNERNPGRYMRTVETQGHARSGSEALDERQARGEFVFLGLRCRQGFAAAAFRERFGDELPTVFPHVSQLCEDGVLRCSNGQWQLTPRGLLLADSVFATFL